MSAIIGYFRDQGNYALQSARGFVHQARNYLSGRQVRMAPPEVAQVEVAQEQDEIPTSCSICREDYHPDDTSKRIRTTCKHYFHEDCLKQWLQQSDVSNHCPLCRTQNPINLVPSNQVDPNRFQELRQRNTDLHAMALIAFKPITNILINFTGGLLGAAILSEQVSGEKSGAHILGASLISSATLIMSHLASIDIGELAKFSLNQGIQDKVEQSEKYFILARIFSAVSLFSHLSTENWVESPIETISSASSQSTHIYNALVAIAFFAEYANPITNALRRFTPRFFHQFIPQF